jgi:hypothetical protein
MPPAASAPGLPSPLVQGAQNADSESGLHIEECAAVPIREVDSCKPFSIKTGQLSTPVISGSYDLDNADQGGEGVENFEAPPLDSTGLGSQKIFDKGVSDAPQDASDSSTLP